MCLHTHRYTRLTGNMCMHGSIIIHTYMYYMITYVLCVHKCVYVAICVYVHTCVYVCDQAYKNQPSEHKLHKVILLLISIRSSECNI